MSPNERKGREKGIVVTSGEKLLVYGKKKKDEGPCSKAVPSERLSVQVLHHPEQEENFRKRRQSDKRLTEAGAIGRPPQGRVTAPNLSKQKEKTAAKREGGRASTLQQGFCRKEVTAILLQSSRGGREERPAAMKKKKKAGSEACLKKLTL